ncbi:acetate--CoA ligase family protein [Geodermatophilaceae bacterium NBWT11]|nr:acetate--CoA ligase family protein [Geodermatophilaceae bacterium NBWT11]
MSVVRAGPDTTSGPGWTPRSEAGAVSTDVRYRPRSLAVVGASPSSFVGRIALQNCLARGYGGRLVAVTPAHREVAGVPAVPSLLDLDEPVDTALVQVRADRVLGVVREGVRAGVGTFVVPGAGTTDSGDVARELVRELRDLADTTGVTVVGPNCMGVVDLVTGAAPYIGTVGERLRRGGVGLVAQSGAVVEAFINAGSRVPLSTAISSGSEAVLGLADHLGFFATDPHTTAVLTFVEAVDDATAVLAAARALAEADKPLVAVVVGRSAVARAGVVAHSGRLAGSARTTAAALRSAGAAVVGDLDELLAAGELLGTRHRVRGRRLAVVTNSGGEGNLLADLAADVGLDVPPLSADGRRTLTDRWPLFDARNPLDPWGVDDHTVVYPPALAVAAGEGADVLVVGIDQQRTAGSHEQELGLFLAGALRDAVAGTTVVPVLLSPAAQDPPDALVGACVAADVPLVRGARPALAALAALAARSVSPAPPTTPGASGDVPRAEDEVLAALAGLGLEVAHSQRVRTSAEAVAAALSLGGPVVLKGVVPGLVHKTEAGLVRVGLTPDEVAVEADRMLGWATAEGRPLELLVAELVRGDLEVLVGFTRDPVFGPVHLVGLGGVWAEALDVVDVHVGHLDDAAAGHFLAGSRVGRMLAGARGGPLHSAGVVAALCAVSRLAARSPSITAIDVNPVLVCRSRAVAVDAVLTLDALEAQP